MDGSIKQLDSTNNAGNIPETTNSTTNQKRFKKN